MQQSLTYRTNRDLFSNYYLDEHLPETEEWDEISIEELREKRAEIIDLWEREKGTVAERTESGLEEKFIRPMFRKLGIPFEVEETVQRGQRRPDYGFFPSEDIARQAFDHKNEGGDFYENAVAVADAKRWGRPLDTRGSGEHKRDFENPSYQIHVYLQEVDAANWAVLTDGKKWRLYYGPTSHRLDSYYEVDLPTILEQGNLDDFKYFYLFFRHGAFLEDAGGDCFLDDVYGESNVFAQELGEDLQDNIYEAIKVLSEGYLQYPENDLTEEDLDLIHDSSLIYLYRLIFVLYAEAEGRDLLDTDNEIYEESYSLNSLKQEIAEELDSGDPKYRNWQDDLSSRLDELFELIDQGSKSRGIPEEDLHIPAYNGGLFRTGPDEDDGVEARFLAEHTVGDAYLARVVDLLTRSHQANGSGKIFVDYSSLDVRHLGSVYEGLLEYQLNVADGPLAVDDGEYVEVEEGDEAVVHKGEVYLTTGSGERKATGSYYTPEYVVEYVVVETLKPLVADIRKDLVGQTTYRKGDDEAGTFADEFAERVFDLKVLDPAMGSGHFLTSAVDYLAREIIDAQERQAAQQGMETVDENQDINWARRKVAQRCIYGVDLNPLATELAKVSLWLRTLAAEQPLAFLDHHLKTGNSLVGSNIENVLTNGESAIKNGQLTLQQSFVQARREALKHVMDRFQDLLSIDNESLEDVKEMEAAFDEVRNDPLYQHLLAMANVHTAGEFGLNIPKDTNERMAEALRENSWNDIEEKDWFRSAQVIAAEECFFHWELEFPVAFYNQNGEQKEDGGFDVVIGNPPWISMKGKHQSGDWSKNEIQYYIDSYGIDSYRPNLFEAFIQVSLTLTRSGGYQSFIVPDRMAENRQFKNIRSDLLNMNIQSLVFRVDFPNIITDTLVYVVENSDPDDKIRISDGKMLQENQEGVIINQSLFSQSKDKSYFIVESQSERDLLHRIFEENTNLATMCETNTGFIAAGGKIKNSQENDEQTPCVKGEDIQKYLINGSHYINFIPDNLIGGTQNESVLKATPKVLLRKTGSKLIAAHTEEAHPPEQSLYQLWDFKKNFPPQTAVAILNSSIIQFIYSKILITNRESTPQLKKMDLDRVPVPSVLESKSANKLNNRISALVKSVTDAKSDKQSLNLQLLDYLEIPSDGLPESMTGVTLKNLRMPVDGVADTPLNKTTKAFDGLRIEGVSFSDTNGRLVVSVIISYKVDEDDPRETDGWGRLVENEFETYEAMAFTNLSENEKTLIRNFIPVAVEKAGGFAGFRCDATKTISLLDRLHALKIPRIDEVLKGLEQYIKTRKRADELHEEINKTNRLIDETVYDLYGLTDEEIKIVESALVDD